MLTPSDTYPCECWNQTYRCSWSGWQQQQSQRWQTTSTPPIITRPETQIPTSGAPEIYHSEWHSNTVGLKQTVALRKINHSNYAPWWATTPVRLPCEEWETSPRKTCLEGSWFELDGIPVWGLGDLFGDGCWYLLFMAMPHLGTPVFGTWVHGTTHQNLQLLLVEI